MMEDRSLDRDGDGVFPEKISRRASVLREALQTNQKNLEQLCGKEQEIRHELEQNLVSQRQLAVEQEKRKAAIAELESLLTSEPSPDQAL